MTWEEKISREVELIDIDKLEKSPLNPREFLGNIEELTDTVVDDGVIEPLIVRPIPNKDGCYEILCGWRRFLAASNAGMKKVPCRIANVTDEEALFLIGIEDVQKEELQPYERAVLYQKMLDELGMSQRELSAKLGIPRQTIQHYLYLLRLPDDLAREVRPRLGTLESPQKTFTLLKAYTILNLPEKLQRYFYQKIRTVGMSEDEVSKKVKEAKRLLTSSTVEEVIEYLENPPVDEGPRPEKLVIELPENLPKEKVKEVILIVEENGTSEIHISLK